MPFVFWNSTEVVLVVPTQQSGTHGCIPTTHGSNASISRYWLVLTTTLWVSLSSCAGLTGIKDYQRPDVPSKSEWSQTTEKPVTASDVIRPDWWTNFRDPYLDSLVQQAIGSSIDLKIAVARVERAEAEFGGAQDRSLPTVNVGAGAQFQSQRSLVPPSPGVLPLVPGLSLLTAPQGKESFRTSSSGSYSLQGALNWEIDIWGKLKKGAQAAEAGYKATEADWRATYLTMVTEVADTYFLIRLLDELLDQQQRTLTANQQILSIYQAQFNQGIASSTQILSQKSEINRLTTQQLDFKRQRILAENSLATLLGKPAGDVKVPAASLRDKVHLVTVPVGLPSDLLARRPDIIAAEYRVLQAYQLVGEAKLARLPSISLTASGGFASTALSTLLKTWTFGIGPSINIPIFDPTLKANVKIREAENREVEELYRKTILTAFQEVEDALTNLAYRKQQKEQLEEQAKQLRLVRDQMQAQLRAGVVSYLQVFETERSLLDTEQGLLTIHQQILSDTVRLYKALGGGWPRETIKVSLQADMTPEQHATT